MTHNENGHPQLEWNSLANATYRLERTSDLKNWNTLPGEIPSGGTTTSFTDDTLLTSAPPALYYRVRELNN